MDGEIQVVGLASCREDNRYLIIRGSKSRNKVAVGEPAAGSFFRCPIPKNLEECAQQRTLSHSKQFYFLPLDPLCLLFWARGVLSTAPTTCRDG